MLINVCMHFMYSMICFRYCCIICNIKIIRSSLLLLSLLWGSVLITLTCSCLLSLASATVVYHLRSSPRALPYCGNCPLYLYPLSRPYLIYCSVATFSTALRKP